MLILIAFSKQTIHAFFLSSIASPPSIVTTADIFYDENLQLAVDNRIISETITNGSFEQDLLSWFLKGKISRLTEDVLAGNVVRPVDGGFMVRIGASESAQFTNNNRLSQAFPNTARSLSFNYLLVTADHDPFDNPILIARLNGQIAYKVDTTDANYWQTADGQLRWTEWKKITLDLSHYTGDYISLDISVENGGDSQNMSWVYLDNITTNLAVTNPEAVYSIQHQGKKFSGYFYKVNQDEWLQGQSFSLPTNSNSVSYFAVFADSSQTPIFSKNLKITQKPSSISDLLIDGVGSNSAVLSWSINGLAPDIYSTHISYATNCDSPEYFKYDSPQNYPVTSIYGKQNDVMKYTIFGLNPNSEYCIAIKVSNQAGDLSEISNIVTFSTLTSNEAILPGDLVINELMWMGSSISKADEWLELHNQTNRMLDLKGIKLTQTIDSSEQEMIMSFNNKNIAPYGYFLIANSNNYSGYDSQLNVPIDVTDSSLNLDDNNFMIKLYSKTGLLLDIVGDGGSPFAGIFSSSLNYFSMARVLPYFSENRSLNWFSSINPHSGQDFFDPEAIERGTPRSRNY